jgi:hypothetical protein
MVWHHHENSSLFAAARFHIKDWNLVEPFIVEAICVVDHEQHGVFDSHSTDGHDSSDRLVQIG